MNVLNRAVLLLSFILASLLVQAQTGMQQGEYFWDADPGMGNATPVNTSSGSWDIWLSQLLVSNAGIPTNGTHTLSIRVKDGLGVWGPAYKRIINFSAAVRPFKVTAAELFVNTDPGEGNAIPLIAFDNNFNAALENLVLSNYNWPATLGTYSLGIRIKDEQGVWGPIFRKSFAVKNDIRDIKITSAEYFWNTDPGEGNGQVILAIDGDFNLAYEQLIASNVGYPTQGDLHTSGIRIKDEVGMWGPVYRRVVKSNQNLRNIKITAGEIFWDNDPGLGNGIAVVAYDNNYTDALEQILLSSTSGLPTSGGAHLFHIRFKDESSNWGPVFKRVITRQQTARDIKVVAAEYFWDNDPGQGQGNILLALDGNLNAALEGLFNTVTLPEGNGLHTFHIRVKDETGVWGPLFSKSIRKGNEQRLAQLTLAEYFWGLQDPGAGLGSALVVFDGQFNQAIESLLGYEIPAPAAGTQLFNLRVQDEDGNWGPLYKRSISVGEPLNLYITSYNNITSICQGDSLHLFAHGGVNYQWSPLSSGANVNAQDVWVKPQVNTTYKVKAFVDGVLDSAYFDVIVNPNPVLQVNNPYITLGSFAVLNVSGANAYTWTPGVSPLNTAASSVTVAPSENTVYTVVGLNTNTGCTAQALANVTISDPPFSSYPYPTNQNLRAGEYFWDVDPGQGNALAVEIIDGNWNAWLEGVLLNAASMPSNLGLHTLNIRVKDRDGNWGATYKRVFRKEDFNLRTFDVSSAEYFWDNDPGLGSASILLAFDGNYSDALEIAYVSDSTLGNLPAQDGLHTFNIRVRDDLGIWGPVYTKTVVKGQTTRLSGVMSGEYFWDADPGQGQAIPVVAFDGNFQGALEQIAAATPTLPTIPGGHIFNIRVKDESGMWGATYKRSIFVIQQVRNMKISLAEYFWDNDPGEGQGTSLLAVDGNYNRALEQVWTSAATTPSMVGEHLFGVRVRDENNVWGPVYKRVMRVGNDSRLLNITTAEYFWDADPGEGNGSALLVFDGNYNAAFENLLNNNVSIPSPYTKHTFNVRVRDEVGNWGPIFKRVIQTGEALRDIRITSAEYFWGDQDPGEGMGTAIIAYDGNFNKALEYLFTNDIQTTQTGVQLFNIRVSDDLNVWGPIYKRVINVGIPPILIEVISNQEENAVCLGESIQFTASGASFYAWYNESGDFVGNGTTFSFSPVSDTSLLVVGLDGDLQDSVVLNITVNEPPLITIQSSQSVTCQGGQVVLSASGANAYVWTPGNSLNINYGATVIATPTQNTTYNVVGTNSGTGCSAQEEITIFTTPAITPTVSISANTTLTCPGGSVVFTSQLNNCGNNPQYQWRLNGININGANGPTYTTSSLSNGNTISCQVIPNNVCQSANSVVSNSITIVVSSTPLTPTISISASANNVCAGTQVTFGAAATNSGTNPSYQWKVNGVVQGTQSTFVSSVLQNGDVVTCSLIASGSCLTTTTATSNSIQMVITGSTVPGVFISSSSNPICSNSAAVLSASASNGVVIGYQWKLNGASISGANSSTWVVSSPVNGSVYSCQLTALNSCNNTVTVSSNDLTLVVTQPVIPTITLSQVSPVICSQGNGQFSAQGTNLGSSPAYQWKVNGAVISGYTSGTFNYGPLQNGDLVQCTVITNNNCQSTNSVSSQAITISTNATVTPSVTIATAQTSICSNATATVSATPSNGGSSPIYQWKINGINVNGQNGPVFNYGSLVNGDNVTVQMTSNNLCQTASNVISNTVTYTVLPNIVSTIQITADNTTICQGQNVVFSAAATNFGPTPAYQWRKNGVNISGANNVNYSTNTLLSSDIITCVLFPSNTCQVANSVVSNSLQLSVTPLVTPSISISALVNPICQGDAFSLASSVTNGGVSPQYQWKRNGTDVIGATSSSFAPSSPLNGDVFTCLLIANNQCQASTLTLSNAVSANIQVPVVPSVSIVALNNNICQGTEMEFTASVTNGGSSPSFAWYVNNSLQLGFTQGTFQSAELLNGDVVKCVVQTNNFCQTINSVTSNLVTAQLYAPTVYYEDADYDGYGGTGFSGEFCSQPDGFSSTSNDCDDFNEFVYPGQLESCNHADDDCDGIIDEGVDVASVAFTNAVTKTYPTCSGTNLLQVNFAGGSNSLITSGEGTDVWYRLNAAYNTMRVAYSGGIGENSIEVYKEDNGCLVLQQTENELGVSTEILMTDLLSVGSNYYVAVRNLSGGNVSTGKVCFTHFLGSTCDHYYSNYTGVYDNSCRSFKAAFRANANSYVFRVTGASSNGSNLSIVPWSFTTVNSSTTITRIGTLLPANFTSFPVSYNLSIDAKYTLADAVGNMTTITASSTQPCTATMSVETDLNVRATDRCPVYKSTGSTIATNRAVCGASRYEWSFTRILPQTATSINIVGGLNTTTLNLSTVPGIANGQTYEVKVRAIHPLGGIGNWGSLSCVRTTATAGMVLENEGNQTQSLDLGNGFGIYPNPAINSQFVLTSTGNVTDPLTLKVYDVNGKKIFEHNYSDLIEDIEVDLPNSISSGMYMIEIVTLKNRYASRWLLE